MAEPLSTFTGDVAYLDAVALISHLDDGHPFHGPFSALLARAVDPNDGFDLVTASLTFDEVAIVLLQELVARPPFGVTRNRTEYLSRHPDVVRQLAKAVEPLLDSTKEIVSVESVTGDDIAAMAEAMRLHGMLPRDAIHLAVARRLGISAIVSAEEVFDRVPGIRLYKP